MECTFREVGCLAALHPDEMAAHLDTQIHYHTGVSATSDFRIVQSVSTLDNIQSVRSQERYRKNNEEIFHSILLSCWKNSWHNIVIGYKIFQEGARNLYANVNIQTASGAHSVSSSMDMSIISQG